MNKLVIVGIKTTISGKSVIVSLSTGDSVKLPIDLLVTHHLSIGSAVDQGIIDSAHLYQLREYALSCLARSNQTEKILKRKLKLYSIKHCLPPDKIDEIIKELNNHQLLDPANYVKNYIARYPRKSFQMLKHELSTRGISSEIINQTLTQDPDSELSAAINLVRKKHPTIQKLSDPHQKMLILSSIVRNGFSYSVAKNAIDAYLKSL